LPGSINDIKVGPCKIIRQMGFYRIFADPDSDRQDLLAMIFQMVMDHPGLLMLL